MLNLADTARNVDWLRLLPDVTLKHQPNKHDQGKHDLHEGEVARTYDADEAMSEVIEDNKPGG